MLTVAAITGLMLRLGLIGEAGLGAEALLRGVVEAPACYRRCMRRLRRRRRKRRRRMLALASVVGEVMLRG
jgi:hypothetical protein